MIESFNPQEWLNNNQNDITTEVDKVVTRIEASFTDITTNYADWINVGFAFANEFGERGRSFFQRISRYYNGFTLTECNKQYDQCLKSQRGKITISTFFYLAKQAGIDINTNEARLETGKNSGDSDQWSVNSPSTDQYEEPETEEEEEQEVLLPTLPDEIFDQLPDFCKRVVERAASREERDILLLGFLATISAVLHRVHGIYDGKNVQANLFVFIIAQASAGKGRLVLCKNIVNMIHWELRNKARDIKQKHEVELREFNLVKTKDLNAEKPEKPPELLLYIPANCSSTGVFQLLSDNDGHGLIFETEGDTMAQAFKSDFGNYSDGFRKAFHHETINYYRRTDREYVEIVYTYLSALLTGTQNQVTALIPSSENGLGSRFIFYKMCIKPIWKDVFADGNNNSLEEHFNHIGRDFYAFYNRLQVSCDIQFCFTSEQQTAFHEFFTQVLAKYMVLLGTEYIGTVRRLGLIAFRIAMIFSTLRINETGDFSDKLICRDDDFQSTLSIIRVLVKHASRVFSELPVEAKQVRPKNKKEMFLDKLPEKFTYKEYMEVAKSLLIPERTAKRYISSFCDKGLILHENKGLYINLSFEGGNKRSE